MSKKEYPRLSDALKDGARKEFHAGVPRLQAREALDNEYTLFDTTIIENFEGQYGISSFALLYVNDKSENEFVIVCGGMVVVDKIRKIQKTDLLPLRMKIVETPTEKGSGHYFNIV